MSHDPYMQDGVLRNKFGESNPTRLEILEKREVLKGWIKLESRLVSEPPKLDATFLKDIHKSLFGNLYDWAGNYRSVNIQKGSTMFANALYVEPALNDLFTKMNRDMVSKAVHPGNVDEKLAYYYSELNMIHPFREGNGRTQRIFIEKTAKALGYELRLNQLNQKELMAATIESVNGTGKPLREQFKKALAKMNEPTLKSQQKTLDKKQQDVQQNQTQQIYKTKGRDAYEIGP